MLGAHRFRRHGSATVLTIALLSAVAVVSLATAGASAAPSANPTVEELKARLSSAGIGARPHLCVQIAELQLAETNKLYAGAEDEKAQASLADVVTYSEMARDYAIQSHKYQKQTEIAVREMTRKLTEVMHSRPREDQSQVQDAVRRLQRVCDDLLTSMFPKKIK